MFWQVELPDLHVDGEASLVVILNGRSANFWTRSVEFADSDE